jgi:osmoprotectant transport system ATP-binding protein
VVVKSGYRIGVVPAPEAIPSGSSSDSASVVRYEHVTKRYAGTDAPAVEDLNLEVPAGEICVLVGPSGCGKTTAMRMVNRMIDITDGDILIGGKSVRDRKQSELRREIGYVIQQIGLFPHKTIGENIATVPHLLGWDKRRTRERVEELLKIISLPADFAERYPSQLSGGQRQRVGVARALAADPPLMLMDEPFGAIDPISRERLQNEFLRLQAGLRKTIVFVTHDIDEAIKMGDRIAIMQRGGKLAQYAPPAELLMYPANRFVEDFVGADRALKRLALQRVRDVDLWSAPLVRAGEPVEEARRKLAGHMERHQAEDGYLGDHVAAAFHMAHFYRLIGEPTPKADRIVARVLRDQKADGGWDIKEPDWDVHAGFDAVFILRQLGGDDPRARAAIGRGAGWALRCRNADGGFGHFPGRPSDMDAVYFQLGTLIMAGRVQGARRDLPDAHTLGWGHAMQPGRDYENAPLDRP